MSMIENLNELHAVEEWAVDRTESWTVVVRNRWGTVSLIASDEDGDLFFTRVPTDDAEDVPSGYVDKVPGVDTGLGLGFFFPGRDAGHLSPRYVGKLIRDLLPGEWTMHTLRHRFGTRAYDLTSDLLLVQEMLGHASPSTTRRYVQYDRSRMRATVEELAS